MFGQPMLPQKSSQRPNQCIAACVATLLAIEGGQVPDFNGDVEAADEWLKARGHLTEWHFIKPPRGYCLAWGRAATCDEGHCVVLLDGSVWHDPSGAGIKGDFEGFLSIIQL